MLLMVGNCLTEAMMTDTDKGMSDEQEAEKGGREEGLDLELELDIYYRVHVNDSLGADLLGPAPVL
jgi:hypothetical protein